MEAFVSFHLIIACLHSIHGLIRGENMELGRDSDTGGQVQFILGFLPTCFSMFVPNCLVLLLVEYMPAFPLLAPCSFEYATIMLRIELIFSTTCRSNML
jgi:hypothetical protein